jgi:hypothetical protein
MGTRLFKKVEMINAQVRALEIPSVLSHTIMAWGDQSSRLNETFLSSKEPRHNSEEQIRETSNGEPESG